MTPAERLKASGLIGLIVVVLFFVVHTMLGAVSPASSDKPAVEPQPGSGPQNQQIVSGTPPVAGAVKTVEGAWPIQDDPSTQKDIKDAGTLKLDPNVDPFMPLSKTPVDTKAAPSFQPAAGQKPGPGIEVTPIYTRPLPSVGGPAAPSGLIGSQSPGMAAIEVPEPEIRVVGVIKGDESVATLEISGRIRYFRPGEALAKGYRLDGIDDEGVRLRHHNKSVFVRVGAGINETLLTAKSGGQ
jgi:hypothetical protein